MTALRPVAGRRAQAVPRTTIAPVLGWNTRDNLSKMKEGYASQLDNLFPDEGGVSLRRGTEAHATGMSGQIESLMTYSSPTADKLFAAEATQIYDATSESAVGAASLTGLTNGRWQHTNFGTGGTTYLVAVNGADTPRKFDGSAWSTCGLTGMTSSQLEHVNAHKSRLFFIEKNTMKAWYLATNAVSGALSALSFAEMATKGGYLMAMATWTVDGGAGPDDYAVFITSNGEAIVFAGTDPSSANTWALKGVYTVGPPIGRRCFVKYGADLALLTRDGLVPLSLALTEQQKGDKKIALSDNIAPSWSEAVRQFGSNFGWELCIHPTSRMMITNVPLASGSKTDQYVMNTTTRAWCRFRNIPANCFAVMGNQLYFGSTDGKVYKADTGTGDVGDSVDIVGEVVDTFNYFGNATAKKQVTMVRPNIKSDATLQPILGIDVDFRIKIPTTVPSALADTFATWDVSEWDEDDWAGYLRPQVGWQSAKGIGHALALHMKIATKIQSVNWVSTDWLMKPGGNV